MHKFKLSIGDWSEDGHGQYEFYFYNSNYPVSDWQDAYYKSCLLTGIQFHDTEGKSDNIALCVEYDENHITDEVQEILNKFSLPTKNYADPDYFADLIMKFIGLSMPQDFHYSEAATKKSEHDNITPLNGWWNEKLNEHFGYGLFE